MEEIRVCGSDCAWIFGLFGVFSACDGAEAAEGEGSFVGR